MKLVEDDASMNAINAKVMEPQKSGEHDLPIYEKQLKETEVGITQYAECHPDGHSLTQLHQGAAGKRWKNKGRELQARIAEERLAKPKMRRIRPVLAACSCSWMTQPEQRQAPGDTFINAIYLWPMIRFPLPLIISRKVRKRSLSFGEGKQRKVSICALGALGH